MTTFERESIEFQPVNVTVDGAAVTSGVTFAITPNGQRPTTYTAPTTIGGQTGVMVQDLQPGIYQVWAKITSTPETPVILCGNIAIT
jgi:hypothetical protein